MQTRSRPSFLAFAACVGLLAIACDAQPVQAAADVGEKAPAFDLPKIDGSGNLSLESLLKDGSVVLVWISPQCPYSRACDARFEELYTKLAAQGVQMIGIGSNKTEPPKSLADYAAKVKWTFPIVYDEGNVIADAYAATKTPEVVFIDKEGKVRYRGAIDDNVMKADQVKTRYVEDAAKAIAEGKDPATTTTKAIGCTIKRR